MLTAPITNIQRFSLNDGPGIRTTVFFQGCNMHCAWCHNPETISMKPVLLHYENKCIGCGKCIQVCPQGAHKVVDGKHVIDRSLCVRCGKCADVCFASALVMSSKEMTVEEVMKEIRQDKLYYEESGGGVTFSGGECMLQIDFLEACLKGCKEKGLHTAVDTAGHIPFDSFARILPYTDLFLYDVKAMDREKHQAFTGVPNDLILDNLSKLLSMGKAVWVRVPVIPTVNDTVEEMTALRRFLEKYGHPEKVELLPYHALGEHKYAAIGKKATSFQKPEDAAMEQLRIIFAVENFI